MPSSIRVRLTLSHLAVIVLAMGLSAFLLLSFLERYFLRAMEESLIAQAQITVRALIPGSNVVEFPAELDYVSSIPPPAFNRVQEQQVSNFYIATPPTASLSLSNNDLTYLTDTSFQLSTQLNTRIRILDAQGLVFVDSWQESQGLNLRDDPLVSQALMGQYATRTDPLRRSQDAAMHLAAPVLMEGQLVSVVYLSQPLNDLVTVLRDLRVLWLPPAVLSLLAASIVGLLLSRAIARPLNQLAEAAEAVGGGQLDQEVPVRSRDELGRLSQVFNQMLGRLRAARQAQIDFVANVSHELRTPLTAIKGMVETLRDGAVDETAVRDRFLGTVEGETDRLIRLVNDLLVLSQADSSALGLRCQQVDLCQLTQEVVDGLAAPSDAREVQIQVTAQATEAVAWADPDRVEQILVNLLDNAIKYSSSGSKVTVRLQGDQDEIVVQVQDEGCGISEEHLPRVGERFYRADKARSRAEGGSGLGLSIARALVEAHGGRLWVESQEGQGTVVGFVLPTP
jgi:signal transduction histidine kinase